MAAKCTENNCKRFGSLLCNWINNHTPRKEEGINAYRNEPQSILINKEKDEKSVVRKLIFDETDLEENYCDDSTFTNNKTLEAETKNKIEPDNTGPWNKEKRKANSQLTMPTYEPKMLKLQTVQVQSHCLSSPRKFDGLKVKEAEKEILMEETNRNIEREIERKREEREIQERLNEIEYKLMKLDMNTAKWKEEDPNIDETIPDNRGQCEDNTNTPGISYMHAAVYLTKNI